MNAETWMSPLAAAPFWRHWKSTWSLHTFKLLVIAVYLALACSSTFSHKILGLLLEEEGTLNQMIALIVTIVTMATIDLMKKGMQIDLIRWKVCQWARSLTLQAAWSRLKKTSVVASVLRSLLRVMMWLSWSVTADTSSILTVWNPGWLRISLVPCAGLKCDSTKYFLLFLRHSIKLAKNLASSFNTQLPFRFK